METNIGLVGEYNLVVSRPDGTTTETGWFKNMILDQGLDRIGQSGEVVTYCQIGTGTDTPVVTQVGLVNRVAGSQRTGNSTVVNAGSPTYASIHTFMYTFATGAVVGNMSEIGVGWADNGNNLFSRALITDGAGNPTTITLTSIDQLTAYYKITLAPAVNDSSGTFTIGSTVHTYTSRLANAGSFQSATGLFLGDTLGTAYTPSWSFYTSPATTTTLGPITGLFTPANGWYYGNSGPGGSTAPYGLGSHYLDTTYTFGVNGGNEPGGIGALAPVLGSTYSVPVQYLITPPIPKDNTKTFSMTFRTSWSRGA